MPSFLTYSQAPIPTGAEALNGPANLLAMGNVLDTLVVLKATSQSNRDTLYANVPAGTLVSCAALQTVWMKTTTPPTAAAWVVLAQRGTAVTSGVVSPLANFTVSSQWALQTNGMVSMRATLTYSGSTITGNATNAVDPGNVSETDVCTIQSAYLPLSAAANWPVAMLCTVCTGVGLIGSSGLVQLSSLVPSGVLRSGDTLRFAATYPGA